MRSKELHQSIRQIWQVVHLLEIASKSDFKEMDTIEITEVMAGLSTLLLNAVTSLEDEV